MSSLASEAARRIQAVEWSETDYLHVRSRTLLMKEHLRRSALWAEALNLRGRWPFFDVSHDLHGSDAAPAALLGQVRATLEKKLVVGYSRDQAIAAINLAALRDNEIPLPELPDLYEPLLIMFERGGGFSIDRSGMVSVDYAGVAMKTLEHNAALHAVVSLDAEKLDAIDVEFMSRR